MGKTSVSMWKIQDLLRGTSRMSNHPGDLLWAGFSESVVLAFLATCEKGRKHDEATQKPTRVASHLSSRVSLSCMKERERRDERREEREGRPNRGGKKSARKENKEGGEIHTER